MSWYLIPDYFTKISRPCRNFVVEHAALPDLKSRETNTGWRTKCHTTDCARNTFLLLQKHLTSGTELILIGRKIVPNEEHVQCDHRFASQPLANEPLRSSQLFDTSLHESARHNFTMWALSCATFSGFPGLQRINLLKPNDIYIYVVLQR